jgi:signal transduction histidine kinase
LKSRFIILLAALILFVSLAAISLSGKISEVSVERLVRESAEQRFSLMVWGFSAPSSDVDLYSYLNFEHESMIVTSGSLPVFQYGTAGIDPGNPRLARFERISGGYDFLFLVDIEAELAARLYPVRMSIYITGAIYALFFALFGWIFVSMVADPITDMAATIEQITSRNLKVRLPVPRRKDEFRRLVATFNGMLDDIAATSERQRQLAEDLIHDIATPVQIMEGYRQLIERHGASADITDEFLETSRVQLARLREMTDQLRGALAAERARRVEKADASGITARNLQYYRELHPAMRFNAQIDENVSFGIAPEDLERIEHILLDNAVKYGKSGGRVDISLDADSFSVRDYGIGITPEERNAIFERYHRSPGTTRNEPGSGIGLAILTRFSEEYGFRIELESEPGEGSTFRLRFPSWQDGR